MKITRGPHIRWHFVYDDEREVHDVPRQITTRQPVLRCLEAMGGGNAVEIWSESDHATGPALPCSQRQVVDGSTGRHTGGRASTSMLPAARGGATTPPQVFELARGPRQGQQPESALDGAGGGFAQGDLWAALDEVEKDQRIEAVMEELVEGIGNDDLMVHQESESHDYTESRFDSSNDSEDSEDDEDK